MCAFEIHMMVSHVIVECKCANLWPCDVSGGVMGIEQGYPVKGTCRWVPPSSHIMLNSEMFSLRMI